MPENTPVTPAPHPHPEVPVEAREHAEDLGAFVTAAPSSYHAAAEVARRAEAAGFVPLAETDTWDVAPGGRYVVVRDGSAIAFVVPPSAGATTPFTVLGTHTDSPGFKLKPRPTTGREGWVQAGVEVYGGPLLNSWLDRELELAGRLVTRDGTEHLVRTGPFARIPQLAIHLDRQVNDGLTLDKQRHTQPVIGLGEVGDADVLAALAARAELPDGAAVDPADILGYDVVVADTQAPRAFGTHEELWASGRLDNLLSTHAALTALLGATPADLHGVAVLAAFDHEEIGSESRSGAAGPFLADVLGRVSRALGAGGEDRRRALASSVCVSSDVGHAVHPNYPERHDPANHPRAGGGPILKINANQRYTTDAHGAALWQAACDAARVPTQEFVSNNTIPCGSTIGPITATRLGIRVVDVGVPILSMHSARELTAVVDPWYLARAMGAVLVR
ncbi:M18 family aminopeptidase [Isoptericola sp. S6320L]|uniref:M18 family aminopeptidase n=1 Tax=Isoptericola sp. S6320L TaxID=2926411 RepID=UPI001FF5A59D|nr:M18 family aminopeptidase [Isoptericola sp. S6320L]MCK0118360.1 M18 family aminopeptidase [Isoptericola sp. S6320L]